MRWLAALLLLAVGFCSAEDERQRRQMFYYQSPAFTGAPQFTSGVQYSPVSSFLFPQQQQVVQQQPQYYQAPRFVVAQPPRPVPQPQGASVYALSYKPSGVLKVAHIVVNGNKTVIDARKYGEEGPNHQEVTSIVVNGKKTTVDASKQGEAGPTVYHKEISGADGTVISNIDTADAKINVDNQGGTTIDASSTNDKSTPSSVFQDDPMVKIENFDAEGAKVAVAKSTSASSNSDLPVVVQDGGEESDGSESVSSTTTAVPAEAQVATTTFAAPVAEAQMATTTPLALASLASSIPVLSVTPYPTPSVGAVSVTPLPTLASSTSSILSSVPFIQSSTPAGLPFGQSPFALPTVAPGLALPQYAGAVAAVGVPQSVAAPTPAPQSFTQAYWGQQVGAVPVAVPVQANGQQQQQQPQSFVAPQPGFGGQAGGVVYQPQPYTVPAPQQQQQPQAHYQQQQPTYQQQQAQYPPQAQAQQYQQRQYQPQTQPAYQQPHAQYQQPRYRPRPQYAPRPSSPPRYPTRYPSPPPAPRPYTAYPATQSYASTAPPPPPEDNRYPESNTYAPETSPTTTAYEATTTVPSYRTTPSYYARPGNEHRARPAYNNNYHQARLRTSPYRQTYRPRGQYVRKQRPQYTRPAPPPPRYNNDYATTTSSYSDNNQRYQEPQRPAAPPSSAFADNNNNNVQTTTQSGWNNNYSTTSAPAYTTPTNYNSQSDSSTSSNNAGNDVQEDPTRFYARVYPDGHSEYLDAPPPGVNFADRSSSQPGSASEGREGHYHKQA